MWDKVLVGVLIQLSLIVIPVLVSLLIVVLFACVDDYLVLFMVAKHIFLFRMDLKELHVVISEEMCKLKRRFDRNNITKLEVRIV